MEFQELFLNRQHWSVGQIPYASIARDQVNGNRQYSTCLVFLPFSHASE